MLINAVSLPAKKAASMSNPASSVNNRPRVGCSIRGCEGSAPMAPEHVLENELHAEIGHRQDAEAPQSPANRGSAAPAEAQPPDEQHAEQQPRDERQDRLLYQVLGE